MGGCRRGWEFLYICLMFCETKTVLKSIDLKTQVNKCYEWAIFSRFGGLPSSVDGDRSRGPSGAADTPTAQPVGGPPGVSPRASVQQSRPSSAVISWSREPGLALWGGGEQPRPQKQKEGALSPQIPRTSDPCCSRCRARAACEDRYERHRRAHTCTHPGLAFACLYVHRPRRHGPTQAHTCPACKTSPAQKSAGGPWVPVCPGAVAAPGGTAPLPPALPVPGLGVGLWDSPRGAACLSGQPQSRPGWLRSGPEGPAPDSQIWGQPPAPVSDDCSLAPWGLSGFRSLGEAQSRPGLGRTVVFGPRGVVNGLSLQAGG